MSPNKTSRKYKYCLVPKCTSTTTKYPNKLFVSLPIDKRRRSLWLKAMRRNLSDISFKSSLFVCGDHFNWEEDVKNYIQFKYYKGKRIDLKPDVVPHIFACQTDRSTDTSQLESSPPAISVAPETSVSTAIHHQSHLSRLNHTKTVEEIACTEEILQAIKKKELEFRIRIAELNLRKSQLALQQATLTHASIKEKFREDSDFRRKKLELELLKIKLEVSRLEHVKKSQKLDSPEITVTQSSNPANPDLSPKRESSISELGELNSASVDVTMPGPDEEKFSDQKEVAPMSHAIDPHKPFLDFLVNEYCSIKNPVLQKKLKLIFMKGLLSIAEEEHFSFV